MKESNIVSFETPAEICTEVSDMLSDFLREQAQSALQAAVQHEVTTFINSLQDNALTDGRQRVVKNGCLPARTIQTGIGGIEVRLPRVRDREDGLSGESIRFSSSLVPKYMRRTATLDVLLPILYLRGISTNDFGTALEPMLGSGIKAVSEGVIRQLKSSWFSEFEAWQHRDLSDKQFVYWWADGIYLRARMETEKTCMLVIMGADKDGNKSLIGLHDGFRESKDSWLSLLRQLKAQGLTGSPHCAVGDGALGFWGALNEVHPNTQQQRCWVHKTANVLDKLPKSQRPNAKRMLHDIYLAANKTDALVAWDDFVSDYQLKFPKATQCLDKNKDTMMTFYDFPAEHWIHLRTTNPIESTFATVRHRTKKSKNCFSRNTIVAAVFKLCCEAEKRWKKLNGIKRLADVVAFKTFKDGILLEHSENKEQNQKQAAA